MTTPPYPGDQPGNQPGNEPSDNPYGNPQPGWGGSPPGQPPHPGYAQPSGYGQIAPPKHPQSMTALVLGIVGVAGGFMLCGLPFLLSPVALVMGLKASREIRRYPGRWSGEGEAKAGFVLGIIGTVLMVLALAALAVLVVIALAVDSGSSAYNDRETYDTLAQLVRSA